MEQGECPESFCRLASVR